MLLRSWSHTYAEQPSSPKATLSASIKNQASAVLSFLTYHQEPLGIPGVQRRVRLSHTSRGRTFELRDGFSKEWRKFKVADSLGITLSVIFHMSFLAEELFHV